MLAAARQGSNLAWAALLERLDPQCRLLAHLVLGGNDVDATLQSAYVRAYRARRKGPDDALALLLNHVWMGCGHEIRRRQRREAPAPGRRAQRDHRRTRLGSTPTALAVGALRPEERAVWALVHEAELPVVSVAAALGVDDRVIFAVAERVTTTVEEAGRAPVTPSEEGDAGLKEDADDDAVEASTDTSDLAPADAEAPAEDAASDDTPGDEGDADDDEKVQVEVEEGTLVPEPATPAFWQELGRRLKAERETVAAAPPPPLLDPGAPSPALTPAKAPPVAMQKRASRRSRRKNPDLVEGLAGEASRQRPPRNWPGLLVRVAAVLVAVGILAVAVIALYNAASTARSPLRGDSTADLAQKSLGVLADAGTWSAAIERTEQDGEGATREASLTIAAAEDGSFRFTDESIARLTTYDSQFAAVRDTITGFPPRNDQGVAPGGPDPSPPRAGLPLDDLATAARVLSLEDEVEPETTEINGRPVWELTGSLDDETELTYLVDEETLVPVRITWTRGDVTVRELRFRDVQLGVCGTSYTQGLPAGSPQPANLGFLPIQLGEVQSRTGMSPLTPDFLPGQPNGFEFTGAFVNEAEKVVSLRYADGPQEMVITVRPSPVEAGQPWPDPFDRPDEDVTPEEVTLTGGPFRDAPTQMVSGGTTTPSIWGADGDQAFTVAGDLTAEDLQRVASSLG
ncbi:hypothetical protein BH24ACT4_BH24ACT4_16460 [soil metagenome]